MLSKHFLLDTCIIIDFLRQKDRQNTQLYKLASNKNFILNISFITHTELYAGKSIWENKLAQKELITLLSGLKILPITQKISQKAGQIKAQTNLDLIDSLIAATSLINKIPLVTNNNKHFKKVKGLKIS